jgi:hypothetical protein
MKKTVIVLIMLLIMQNGFTQESQTIFSITATSKTANDNMYLIYDLNVFEYYNLGDEYDSDLKKEVFKKTPEYAEKLTELKKMKAEMLKTTYYLEQENRFGDYDITKKGFNVSILFDRYPNGGQKTIRINEKDIYLKSLPSKRKSFTVFGAAAIDERLFIPMNETNALEIENDKENISIYYFFTPNGKEAISYQFICADGYSFCNTKQTLLKADKVRVIVAHKTTGKIYFDKTYNYQATSTAPTKK